MKLLSFEVDGQVRAGALRGDEVVQLGSSMLDLLAGELPQIDSGTCAYPLDSVELLAPVPHPPKLLACAGNYQEHITEGGLKPVDKSKVVPRLFMKPGTTVLAPGAPLHLPEVTREVDWELELAVVMGSHGQVAGYTVINDISARSLDWGVERDLTEWDRFFDWLNGKWLDGFAPMGPWLVTADEIANPQTLTLELRLNGEVRQHASTSQMIFGVTELMSFASRFMTLEPGDVIATGTPAGVGHTSGTFLKPGDVMEGSIEGIGVLRTPVEA